MSAVAATSGGKTMNRRECVLAGLAVAEGAWHSPVQVQKLFFLLDRNIPGLIGGPHFDFRPYAYGPFDSAVYQQLESLARDGQVEVNRSGSWREHRLSESGQKQGEELLKPLDPTARDYINRVSEFVRNLSFSQLVAAIYKAYPDMRCNSVFQEQP